MMNVLTTYLTDSHKRIVYAMHQHDALILWFDENNDEMIGLVIRKDSYLVKKIPS